MKRESEEGKREGKEGRGRKRTDAIICETRNRDGTDIEMEQD